MSEQHNPSQQERTAVVCDADDLRIAVYRHDLEARGFDIVGTTSNPVDAIHLAELQQPRLVVTGSDYWGMSGIDLALELRRLQHPPEVVLVLRDMTAKDRALDAGCFAVAPEGDAAALERVLDEVDHFLRTGERRTGGDRRAGDDRRQRQDWSKVTRERRAGDDRRNDQRRTDGD